MGGREGRERGCGSSVRTLEGVVAKVSVQVDGGGDVESISRSPTP